ncbi:unnamed protein product, partial [Ectocarpus sp. 8 AP-2014]
MRPSVTRSAKNAKPKTQEVESTPTNMAWKSWDFGQFYTKKSWRGKSWGLWTTREAGEHEQRVKNTSTFLDVSALAGELTKKSKTTCFKNTVHREYMQPHGKHLGQPPQKGKTEKNKQSALSRNPLPYPGWCLTHVPNRVETGGH